MSMDTVNDNSHTDNSISENICQGFAKGESDEKEESSSISISSILERSTLPENDVVVSDDENKEDQCIPIVGHGPIIHLTTKTSKDEKKLEQKITNNLDLGNANTLKKRPSNPNIQLSFNEETKLEKNIPKNRLSKGDKSEIRSKPRPKSKDRSIQIKTKFTPDSLAFISDQLKDFVFSGWVDEREYVDKLKAYRDIVEVDEWEHELNHRLKAVMYSVRGVMEGTKWINITVPSHFSGSYCIWVLLSATPSPGHYWMQIRDIVSDPSFGLKIDIKILREVHSFDGETKCERKRRLNDEYSPDEWKEWIYGATSFNLKHLWTNLFSKVTPSSISNTFRFLAIFVMMVAVGSWTLMKYSCEFMLRIMREFGVFIHHATPLSQSVVAFFEKAVGGIFLLVAMVYRDLRQPKHPPPPPPLPYAHILRGPPPLPVTYVSPEARVFEGDESSD